MKDKEHFYDELLFDDRVASGLFMDESSGEPHYADVLKRWVSGNGISDHEQKIVAKILIYNPEYVLKNNKSEEFIRLLDIVSDLPELQNPLNPEKGLCFYARFYFLLKTGLITDIKSAFNELGLVLSLYKKAGIQIIIYPDYLMNQIDGFLFEVSKKSHEPNLLTPAYIKIISLILNSAELFQQETGFTYDIFPLPETNFTEAQCKDIRSMALRLYENKEYKKAVELYNYLRMARFEISGTLIHMARVEIMSENYQQSKILTEISWLHRQQAAQYIVVRILWFKLCFCFLEKADQKEIQEIIHQLKPLLNSSDAFMSWTMQPVLDHIKPNITEQQHAFLSALVDAMSDRNNLLPLQFFM